MRFALALLSVSLCLLLFEAGLRLVREPMDFLKPKLEPHPVLGFRVVNGTGGHDAWGFRNHGVPEQADIVAIGDSQTWGVAATSDTSRPAWLARKTGRSTYNLGLSGYGPAEYAYLLEGRALQLAPRLIVVGLYFGNDFINAYDSVAGREHWRSRRLPSMRTSSGDTPAAHTLSPLWVPEHPSIAWRTRRWLRHHSMLFRAIEASPVGQLVNAWGDQRAAFSGDGCSVRLDRPFSTVLQPENRFRGLDPTDPAVLDGLELTLSLLDEMATRVAESGAALLVVLIPTKESVLLGSENPAGRRAGID